MLSVLLISLWKISVLQGGKWYTSVEKNIDLLTNHMVCDVSGVCSKFYIDSWLWEILLRVKLKLWPFDFELQKKKSQL